MRVDVVVGNIFFVGHRMKLCAQWDDGMIWLVDRNQKSFFAVFEWR